MSLEVTEWALTRSTKVRARAAIVADVVDARMALDSDDPEVARGFLLHILARAHALPDGGIPVSDASVALGISEPTVRAWLKRGVLQRAGITKPVKVTESSLGEALAAVETIREAGGDGRQLRRVLDAIEDRRTRVELRAAIAELETGQLLDIDPDDVQKLFA
jgi:hypothetical protein